MASSIAASDKIATTSVKLRSCVVCRSRKVRCDKLSPCSNCRRANIPCIVPSADRPPRWARRLNRAGNLEAPSDSAKATQEASSGVDPVIERLHNLENLVKELRGQLEQANAAVANADVGADADGLSGFDSSNRPCPNLGQDTDHHKTPLSAAVSTSEVQKSFGRLVLQDVNRSRYISSGFWARMNDEVGRLAVFYYTSSIK